MTEFSRTENRGGQKRGICLAHGTGANGCGKTAFQQPIRDGQLHPGDGHRNALLLADQAWLYVTILSVGYMISRGLAKSGSRHHDDA